MKNVRDLHPAEKELISIPGNAALEFDAVLAAAKNISLSMEEKQTETIPFYTTLSQLNSYPQKAPIYKTKREKVRDSSRFIKTTHKCSQSGACIDKNDDQYFEYLDKFQNTMTKITTEQKIQPQLVGYSVQPDSNRKHDGEDDISVTTDSGLDEDAHCI